MKAALFRSIGPKNADGEDTIDRTPNSYPAWHPALKSDSYKFFKLCFRIDDDYYYYLEAALMVLSKGGITLDNLLGSNKVIGHRTKDRYRANLVKIHNEMNKTDKDNNDSDDGSVTPKSINTLSK